MTATDQARIAVLRACLHRIAVERAAIGADDVSYEAEFARRLLAEQEVDVRRRLDELDSHEV